MDNRLKKSKPKKSIRTSLNNSIDSTIDNCESTEITIELHDRHNAKDQEICNGLNKQQLDTGLTAAITNLLKLITGFELQEEKIFREKDGTITRDYITVQYPPNLAAIKYYLDNHGRELGFGKIGKTKEKPESIQPPDAIFTREDMSNGQTPPIE